MDKVYAEGVFSSYGLLQVVKNFKVETIKVIPYKGNKRVKEMMDAPYNHVIVSGFKVSSNEIIATEIYQSTESGVVPFVVDVDKNGIGIIAAPDNKVYVNDSQTGQGQKLVSALVSGGEIYDKFEPANGLPVGRFDIMVDDYSEELPKIFIVYDTRYIKDTKEVLCKGVHLYRH